jgi:hypothetical protein
VKLTVGTTNKSYDKNPLYLDRSIGRISTFFKTNIQRIFSRR